MGSPGTAESNRLEVKLENSNYWSKAAVPGLSNLFGVFSDLSMIEITWFLSSSFSGDTSNVKIIEQRIPEIQKTHPFRFLSVSNLRRNKFWEQLYAENN